MYQHKIYQQDGFIDNFFLYPISYEKGYWFDFKFQGQHITNF